MRRLATCARNYGRGWLVATAIYVGAVSTLAAVGATRSAEPLFAAVALTLPLGIVAFIGVYVIYAVLVSSARSLGAQVMNGDGWSPHWFVIVDRVTVTIMFALVATANMLFVRATVHKITGQRHRDDPHPISAPGPGVASMIEFRGADRAGGMPIISVFSGYVAWIAAAVTWSLLLILMALVLPIHTVNTVRAGIQPGHALVQDFGYRVLPLVAVPLVVSVVVGALLSRQRNRLRRWPIAAAWGLAITLLVAAIVGFVTIRIGVFVIPVAVLLCVATNISTAQRTMTPCKP